MLLAPDYDASRATRSNQHTWALHHSGSANTAANTGANIGANTSANTGSNNSSSEDMRNFRVPARRDGSCQSQHHSLRPLGLHNEAMLSVPYDNTCTKHDPTADDNASTDVRRFQVSCTDGTQKGCHEDPLPPSWVHRANNLLPHSDNNPMPNDDSGHLCCRVVPDRYDSIAQPDIDHLQQRRMHS